MSGSTAEHRSHGEDGARYRDSVTIGQNYRTLREVVADEIHGMITRGELQPGDRLYEDRLAEQLGVSRNPVREALRALEGTGLVEVVPRRGAYVTTIEPDQAQQLLELRAVLEAYAAQRAAVLRTDDDLAKLRACLDRGRAASRAGDVVAAAGNHREFHQLIEQAAANEYLDATVAPLRHQTEMIFSMLADTRGVTSWDEHEEICAAIRDGDADRARAATRRHMDNVMLGMVGRHTSTRAR